VRLCLVRLCSVQTWAKVLYGGLSICLGVILALIAWHPGAVLDGISSAQAASLSCPKEMAQVEGSCVDRWEAHMVEHKTGLLLSPFYPPESRLLRHVYQYWSVEASRVGNERARTLAVPPVPLHQRSAFSARAVSAPGFVPHGYLTYFTAKKACENAGKRLCSEEEWVRACKGNKRSQQPYGAQFQPGRCNVFRTLHPAYELHGNSSLGHLDPRLHLVIEEGTDPLLYLTGQAERCVSETDDGQLFDMVGNLDEWVDDEQGTFVGGFYSRATKEGCEAKIDGHAPIYTDYSVGVRCCKDAR
jgi:formylglycine-generating enzyme